MESLINFFFGKKTKPVKAIGGDIAYHQLQSWWMNTFSEEERAYIVERHRPLGTGPGRDSLIEGNITYTSATASMFLAGLATWFQSPEDRHIGRRLLEKSLEQSKELRNDDDVLDRHFALSNSIPSYYRERENKTMLQKAINACINQINLAPKASAAFLCAYPNSPLPTHVGYTQLSIIYEKQGKITEAIALCRQARERGWNGDWDERIARYEKKLAKQLGV